MESGRMVVFEGFLLVKNFFFFGGLLANVHGLDL